MAGSVPAGIFLKTAALSEIQLSEFQDQTILRRRSRDPVIQEIDELFLQDFAAKNAALTPFLNSMQPLRRRGYSQREGKAPVEKMSLREHSLITAELFLAPSGIHTPPRQSQPGNTI